MPIIDDDRIQYYIARQVYRKNRKINKVAKVFNLNYQTTRNNLLKAKKRYLELVPPEIPRLEERIAKALDLQDCFIAMISDYTNKDIVQSELGETASWYLNRMIFNNAVITIGGGDLVRKMISAYKPYSPQQSWSINICALNSDFDTKLNEPPIKSSSFLTTLLCNKFSDAGYTNIRRYHFHNLNSS